MDATASIEESAHVVQSVGGVLHRTWEWTRLDADKEEADAAALSGPRKYLMTTGEL
jgi:hypothetical protein